MAVVGRLDERGFQDRGRLLDADAEGAAVIAGADCAGGIHERLGGGGADAGVGIDLERAGDEAFRGEAVVQEALDNLMQSKKRTTIVVAHR